jgi:4-hydroxy-tetrahydrodipicolinate synthase
MTQDNPPFSGIYCAIVTPLRDGRLDLDKFQMHIRSLMADGCNGVLVAGTTGEGASLSIAERCELVAAARDVSDSLVVMAGTGCASLPDTIQVTRQSYELGADAVLIVPPFFFRDVTTQGLKEYYRIVFEEAVPDSGGAFLYHIPQVSGIPIAHELLDYLIERFGDRVAGIKDSQGDRAGLVNFCQRFPNLRIFAGLDDLLLDGLKAGGAGYITAEANLLAAPARELYRGFHAGEDVQHLQDLLIKARVMLPHTSFPAALKGLLALRYDDPSWAEVRPPLVRMELKDQSLLSSELRGLGLL